MRFLLYDAQCGFCKKWIIHWKRLSGHAVSIIPLQDYDLSKTQITIEQLKTRIHFINTDNSNPLVYTGAKAVLYTLYLGGHYRWLWYLYRWVMPFRWICESVYWLIARNRNVFTRLK